MISFFKVDMKLSLTRKGIECMCFNPEEDGYNVIVTEDWDCYGDDLKGRIKSLRSERTFAGHMDKSWFNYYGKSVNNEVYQLVENNIVKSFQAVLDDGRIVNISCLN